MIRHSLLSLVVASSVAFAVPRVTGSTAELGTWTVPSGPELKDDGVAPDLVAGDGLFAASVSFAAAGDVDYKVAPNGVDFTGALGTNSGTNMRFTLAGTAPFAVVFTYDTRALGTQGWAPSPVSFSDSATATRAWVAVGDFQLAVGDTGNWNQASTVTAAVDDGSKGDLVAGDGIYTYRFVAPSALTAAQYKFAAQGAAWSTKFGTNGWSFDPQDSTNATFTAAAGELVTLEFDALRGHLRSRVGPNGVGKLVISEVVVSPTPGEYIEIYNPGTVAVDLSDVYLSDVHTYYTVVQATPSTVLSTDFVVRFPPGASIPAGGYQTVSIVGAECFQNACATVGTFTGYGAYPTYELFAAGDSSPSVPDMVAPFTGAVGGSRGLTNSNELAILFFWNGVSDLVTDVDYVFFGSGTNPPVNKSGVAVDGPDADTATTTYAPDTADAAARHAPIGNNTSCRLDFAETGQPATGGNGLAGRDEIGEDASATWRACTWAVTPGAPTPHAVEVTPATATIVLAGTQVFNASVWGDLARAQSITGTTLAWTTTPATPLTLSFDPGTRTATGTAAGTGELVKAGVGTLGPSATSTVTVVYKAITVTCDKTTIGFGGTATCTAQAFDANDAVVPSVTFTWDVSGGTSATVNATTGVVTGSASTTGATIIRARASGDSVTQGSLSVSVDAPVLTGLTLALTSTCPSSDCLVTTAGSSFRGAALATFAFSLAGVDQFGQAMAVTGETWASSNTAAAPNPVAGSVTTLDVDAVSTNITAAAGGVTSNTIALAVEQRRAASVTLTGVPAAGDVAQGGTAQLTATVQDQFGGTLAGQTVTWVSSDPGIATVSSGGLVTATNTLGSTVITATAGTATANATINVVAAVRVVTTVTVSPSTASVEAGQTTPFTATALDQFGVEMTPVTFTWASSDAGVATVDSAGVATGVAAGPATITASSGGQSGTAALTVTAVPPVVTTVTVSPATASVVAGQTTNFTAAAVDQYGATMTGITFTWTSSDTGAATVSSAGVATGVAAGTATITASASGQSGSATLTVTAAPPVLTTITVSPATASVVAGQTTPFTAAALDQYGVAMTGVTFTWVSSDTAAATVSSAGVATGVAAGTATITASAGGQSGSAALTVTAAPVVTTITVSPATASVEAGQTTPFTAAAVDQFGAAMTGITFAWDSSDTAVATVSSAGVATGVAAGSATVTASAGGQSGSATLTVTAAPPVLTTVTVSPATASVQAGQTSLFTATGLDQNGGVMAGTTFTWTSSDTAVATVDSAGLATGLVAGQTTLTASSGSVSGTAVLTVTVAPPVVDAVVVTPSTGTVAVGGTLAFTAEARDASGAVISGATIDWSSETAGVATVAASGVATGVAPGTSIISATSGGKSGTATLTVTSATPVVATVVVNPATVTLEVGKTVQLTASAMDASSAQVGGVTFLWSSSGDNVATVAADGTVTAKVAGQAIISATTGSVSGASTVTVIAPKRVSGCGCAAGSEGMGGLLGFLALAGLATLRRPFRRRS